MTGGTRTNIRTIEQMEAEAKDAHDSFSNKIINGQWLQVERVLDALQRDRFEYMYGKRIISRDEAHRLVHFAEARR